MQLSLTQSVVFVLLVLDGTSAAVIPHERRAALVTEPQGLVDPVSVTGLEILPDVTVTLDGLHMHQRGLLDPLLGPNGILGALPGLLTGLLGTVTNVLGGVLGGLGLGSILIADPSTGAQGMHVYLVQASNTSIAMATATNATDPALLAATNMSNSDLVLATLHVPVVNQTTMNIADMCITSTGPSANNMTASPCRDVSLAQLFVYNTKNNAVYSVTDLLTCSYAAGNATTASPGAALTGTANIIMVERDAPTLPACNGTMKAITFTPANSNPNTQAPVTVAPGQAVGTTGSTTAPSLDYAAGDHDPNAMTDGTANNNDE
ncbi:hypothetical protein DACRYDRAFT_117944 [Dacryopinax primogenitus]|uniref:Ricin B lectin domain-containing protein n=1 Tax=Dacryopinax primogenitus (strain DJM 731) TaxID=1858805 RepID=M5FQI7_DACPD|nr:uncharacterized protein DACRYDRAFT_117944 [Dacryopinax primogenitus]EJT99160.1 hypothetical protein DACRYDRAFT_117944 [Dacryopinax primogenitus]